MPRLWCLLTVLLLASAARADFVFYRLPGSGRVITLQGSFTVNTGGTVTYRHPRYGTVHLGLEDTKRVTVPSPNQVFERQFKKAIGAKDAKAALNACIWGLQHGLLKQFHEGIDQVLLLDPNNPIARKVKSLKQQIDTPLPTTKDKEQGEFMKKLVKRPDMQVATSKHYMLLHDTPNKPRNEFHKLPRAAERLELLERVYESYMLLFYSKGIEMPLPEERLMVVLFNEHRDYLFFATELSPSLSSASGFYSPDTNVAFFFDHGTTETFADLQKLSEDLKDTAAFAKKNRRRVANVKELVRLAGAVTILIEIEQENADITVVSHEATHQLAGNTGLFPKGVLVPKWVHEGLATYFEVPGDASWAGIGAVNQERLDFYRVLESDAEHSNVDFIVSDKIFSHAAGHGSILHAYGQAWALTHYMIEHHFDKLLAYYRRLGQLPPDILFDATLLNKLFDETFGDQKRTIESQWRVYMKGLKTDLEKAQESIN